GWPPAAPGPPPQTAARRTGGSRPSPTGTPSGPAPPGSRRRYLVREAPEKDVQGLKILSGHLKEKQFVTKIRKTFTKGEMDDDLLLVPAKLGAAEDHSEYDEILPTSPP